MYSVFSRVLGCPDWSTASRPNTWVWLSNWLSQTASVSRGHGAGNAVHYLRNSLTLRIPGS